MMLGQEIVITGAGVVSPIGIGGEAFWASLIEGRSGARWLDLIDDPDAVIGAEVLDFKPKKFVRPRKSLKVMNRDIQLAFVAADFACEQAGFHQQPADPERLGIVFGADLMHVDLPELADAFRGCLVDGKFDFSLWGRSAMGEMHPLWMLKYLPNMPACHIGIAQDARGPNNSLTLGSVSSLAAVGEAIRVLGRGQTDAIIAGGASSRIHPTYFIRRDVYELSGRHDDPTAAVRPFDADRDGAINGEGAGAFVLETRSHAEARGATILARVLGYAGTFEPRPNGEPLGGRAVRQAIIGALDDAGLAPSDIGHVNADGASTILADQIEAGAIREILGDVPVTAPKSFFGNLGAGTGAVELMASLLSFEHQLIPPTLNYEHPDPKCPVQVVHGAPQPMDRPTALVLNQSPFGQAVALVLAGP